MAPDYALVPQESIQEFVIEAKRILLQCLAEILVRILTIRRLSMIVIKRIQEILADAQEKGAQIIECSAYDTKKDGRRMQYIVLNCSPQMRIMKEEHQFRFTCSAP